MLAYTDAVALCRAVDITRYGGDGGEEGGEGLGGGESGANQDLGVSILVHPAWSVVWMDRLDRYVRSIRRRVGQNTYQFSGLQIRNDSLDSLSIMQPIHVDIKQ